MDLLLQVGWQQYKRYGVEFSYVDTSNIQDVEEAFKDNTAAVFIETPSNPTIKVSDIAMISELAHSKNAISIVDNTFLTPYYQRPLELGADIVVHSGTKYLGGHNDTLAGFIITRDEDISERLKLIQKSEGAVLSPFDSWLLLRGIKTLGVRLDRQQDNAMMVAQWLSSHKKVVKVYYAGLKGHRSYALSEKQATGFGAMVSFEVKDVHLIEQILKKVKVVIFAESLGGVESLITYPIVQTHSAIPAEMRNSLGVNERLLRLSVGIENINDIISDLEQAMN
jgi:cystathionine gamma-synthase